MINSFKTALLLSYICIASVSAAIITPALPHIQSFFSLSKGSVEWIVSIFLLGYVIGQLIYAPIANRYGRLKALRTGLFINLIGILICITSTYINSFSLLITGRLVTALGAASGLSCTFMLINELLPSDRAKHAMSLSIISFTTGIGLAVLLGSLITQYFKWQDCFLLLLVHGIIMYCCTFAFPETLKSPKAIHPKIILEHYLTAFKNPKLVVFSLVIGFVSVFTYGYSASAPIYTQTILHLSPSQYGYWNILNMTGMLTSGILSAYLIKKYHEKNVLITGFVLVFFGLVMLSFMTIFSFNYSLLFFAITTFLYLTSGLLFPSASIFASTAISDRASASSVMSFINMGSAMIGVIIMGYLPLQSIISFTAVLSVFFTVVLLLAIYQLSTARLK
ncbi:MAG: MFS transporter [Gammaproteobacteria bacterium CG_4_10_14_0_8_um_filter_38_16]|nr:MAG: MFS transporter [Gammaproteobacteria bacterium CG_4_10_14_0_8_um_filter_38_16]PJA03501.1 MAG: MFS transporter [Gammaproteobacteria bacterium CG_4_10_14_0_2_um_filter_38_22]PJB10267.1 MAG: MFS transporter [Gammaproteobacteria bacterium CG_4_9_14_3_um_filter_38_9]